MTAAASNVVEIVARDTVDSAWNAYAAHVARSRAEPGLLLDREYVQEWARLERRFKKLFLMWDGGER